MVSTPLCEAGSDADLEATLVGSAGISLSGGQKQRLALARAIYSRKRLVMLDDIFSGLDAETEEHIFTALLGKEGLFRTMGTTVLLATHAVHRLSYADHIIALDPSGRIIQQGSFEEVKSTGYVQSLSVKTKTEERSPTGDKNIPEMAKVMPSMSVADEEIDLRTADLNRQTGDIAVYKHYFGATGIGYAFSFAAMVAVAVVGEKMPEFLLTFVRRSLLFSLTYLLCEFGNTCEGD